MIRQDGQPIYISGLFRIPPGSGRFGYVHLNSFWVQVSWTLKVKQKVSLTSFCVKKKVEHSLSHSRLSLRGYKPSSLQKWQYEVCLSLPVLGDKKVENTCVFFQNSILRPQRMQACAHTNWATRQHTFESYVVYIRHSKQS